MKKIRIVFQGDSVTDAKRDKRNFHDMGTGYAKYASGLIAERFFDTEFDFINMGIGGNRTDQLFDRIYPDAIAFDPDIISVLIGINDVWHRYCGERIETTDEQLEVNYRSILKRLRAQTHAKIIMIAPYLLDHESVAYLRPEVERIQPIIKKLAEEYADVFIPLNELFDEALKTQPTPCYYSADGVHPNQNGAEFIGRAYFEAAEKIISEL